MYDNAGRHYSSRISTGVSTGPTEPLSWPSSDQVHSKEERIAQFREEADRIIGELKDLGIDGDIFTINGHS